MSLAPFDTWFMMPSLEIEAARQGRRVTLPASLGKARRGTERVGERDGGSKTPLQSVIQRQGGRGPAAPRDRSCVDRSGDGAVVAPHPPASPERPGARGETPALERPRSYPPQGRERGGDLRRGGERYALAPSPAPPSASPTASPTLRAGERRPGRRPPHRAIRTGQVARSRSAPGALRASFQKGF